MSWRARMEQAREAGEEAWREAEFEERLLMVFLAVFALNAALLFCYLIGAGIGALA